MLLFTSVAALWLVQVVEWACIVVAHTSFQWDNIYVINSSRTSSPCTYAKKKKEKEEKKIIFHSFYSINSFIPFCSWSHSIQFDYSLKKKNGCLSAYTHRRLPTCVDNTWIRLWSFIRHFHSKKNPLYRLYIFTAIVNLYR